MVNWILFMNICANVTVKRNHSGFRIGRAVVASWFKMDRPHFHSPSITDELVWSNQYHIIMVPHGARSLWERTRHNSLALGELRGNQAQEALQRQSSPCQSMWTPRVYHSLLTWLTPSIYQSDQLVVVIDEPRLRRLTEIFKQVWMRRYQLSLTIAYLLPCPSAIIFLQVCHNSNAI